MDHGLSWKIEYMFFALFKLSLEELAWNAWNSGSGCVSAEERIPFVDIPD